MEEKWQWPASILLLCILWIATGLFWWLVFIEPKSTGFSTVVSLVLLMGFGTIAGEISNFGLDTVTAMYLTIGTPFAFCVVLGIAAIKARQPILLGLVGNLIISFVGFLAFFYSTLQGARFP